MRVKADINVQFTRTPKRSFRLFLLLTTIIGGFLRRPLLVAEVGEAAFQGATLLRLQRGAIADLQLDSALTKRQTFWLVLGNPYGAASLFGFRAASTKLTARDHVIAHELPSKHDSRWTIAFTGSGILGAAGGGLITTAPTHLNQALDTCAHEILTS